jgi:hypothetical protein
VRQPNYSATVFFCSGQLFASHLAAKDGERSLDVRDLEELKVKSTISEVVKKLAENVKQHCLQEVKGRRLNCSVLSL